jgi:hypothetical protein
MPPEYWRALLDDPLAEAKLETVEPPVRLLRLSEIPQHVLRVSCRRCARIVEIQKTDATRLYGEKAVWISALRAARSTTSPRTVVSTREASDPPNERPISGNGGWPELDTTRRTIARVDFRIGSISEIGQRPGQVRSCLNSGHAATAAACPFRVPWPDIRGNVFADAGFEPLGILESAIK